MLHTSLQSQRQTEACENPAHIKRAVSFQHTINRHVITPVQYLYNVWFKKRSLHSLVTRPNANTDASLAKMCISIWRCIIHIISVGARGENDSLLFLQEHNHIYLKHCHTKRSLFPSSSEEIATAAQRNAEWLCSLLVPPLSLGVFSFQTSL